MGACQDDTRPTGGHAQPMATDTQRLGIRYVGGPTALLRVAGLRLLSDPTFGLPMTIRWATGSWSRRPAPRSGRTGWGAVDAVLLSHDQHPDNLDTLGRA
jgi:L-ascorbate metabolism protein UlaG (beta-lactamase superfamily)